MEIEIIVAITIAHFIGDWVFQSTAQPWMGKKGTDKWHLIVHGVALTIPLVFVGVWFLGVELGLWWAAFNGVVHVAVDFITSKMTHKHYADDNIELFFLVIGADQTIHFLTLFISWSLIA